MSTSNNHSTKSSSKNDLLDTENLLPLTKTEHQAIAKAEPKEIGEVVGSLL